MNQSHTYAIQTRVVQSPPDPHGAVTPPIYLSSTFSQEPSFDDDVRPGASGAAGEAVVDAAVRAQAGYGYQRTNNPTRAAAEYALANVENAKHALAFASGMAAISAALEIVKPGQAVVISDNIYGGTYTLAKQVLARRAVEVHFEPNLNEATELPENLGAVLIESPTNPTLRVIDIAHAARLAHARRAKLIVDNTFSTAFVQRPLELGADAVVYSATKYQGGHSDVLAGALLTNDPELYAFWQLLQKEMGAPLSPFDSYSLVRGMKTMALRLERAQENALAIRDFLRGHPAVERVYFPGWYSRREGEIQARQASGEGALLAFEVREGVNVAAACRALQLVKYAVSLGSVETLISHSASMTHEDMSEQDRARAGITTRFLRLSVGIEFAPDIIDDLNQALNFAASR